MRRKEKEITSPEEIEAVIKKASVCRLGLSINDTPYIVPMNFGYKDGTLFFHSARQGRKIETLSQNKRICFEMDIEHEIKSADSACEFGMKYISVIGFGDAEFIEDTEGKKKALDIIMEHYKPEQIFEYNERLVKRIKVFQVKVQSMTGKKSN